MCDLRVTRANLASKPIAAAPSPEARPIQIPAAAKSRGKAKKAPTGIPMIQYAMKMM